MIKSAAFERKIEAYRHAISRALSPLMQKYDPVNASSEEDKKLYERVHTTFAHECKTIFYEMKSIPFDTRDNIQIFLRELQLSISIIQRLESESVALRDEVDSIVKPLEGIQQLFRDALRHMGGPNEELELKLDLAAICITLSADYGNLGHRLIPGMSGEDGFAQYHKGIGTPLRKWLPIMNSSDPRSPSELRKWLEAKKADLSTIANNGGFPLEEERNAVAFAPWIKTLDEAIARCDETLRGRRNGSEHSR